MNCRMSGSYVLAGGADGFSRRISVTDDLGGQFYLSVGEAVGRNNVRYSLGVSSGSLVFAAVNQLEPVVLFDAAGASAALPYAGGVTLGGVGNPAAMVINSRHGVQHENRRRRCADRRERRHGRRRRC